MTNKRMLLSERGKVILDQLVNTLEVDRPQALKIALAKGIANSDGVDKQDYSSGTNKWTIPDVIKDKEYTLFKHLIINEHNKPIEDKEIPNIMVTFIEHGLRIIDKLQQEKSSMEELRLMIL